ncbi:MAG: VanW family protein, partial [Firmicutes bacterium]|nr:VanW family protein [Bacillota bacterium]
MANTITKRVLVAIFFLMLLLCVLNVSKVGMCENLDELKVSLNIDGKEYTYKYPDITYKSGIEQILIKNGKYDVKGRLKSIDKNFSASYECRTLEKDLIEISKISEIEPVDASVRFDSDNKRFVITKEVNGRKLNTNKILDEVQKSLNKGKSYKGVFSSEIIVPKITESMLKKSLNVRSVFSTDFSSSTPERKNNIALSLKKLDGLIITPNQEISFNEIVGPRTTANGFLKAKIIMDNEFVDGVGGGVCQASTTLYNALLLADISITRYSKHSLKVGYVLPSFDAMVSSASDLKFK